ncbi:MAG: hypothetical protein WBB98_14465 [Xanthobacteraceae bacterium]
MKIRVRQITEFTSKKTPKFDILCTATVEFTDIEIAIAEVALTWSKSQGYGCLPPAAEYGKRRVVHWRKDSEVHRRIVAEIKRAYIALGYRAPEAESADAIDAAMDAVEAELAQNGGSLMDASAAVYERDDWQDYKAAAFAECDKAVENAKRKRKASDAAAAERRVAERKAAVAVRTVEEIDADIAEMGLSRPETAGLARTLGIA